MIRKIENTMINIGNKILKYKNNYEIKGKRIGDQLKTNIDIYADKILKKELKKIKKIPVISEENTNIKIDKYNEYWLIDPIDGTKSLFNNFKGWVTQVAYIKKNKILIGVVYAPELCELYSGSGFTNKLFFNKKIIRKNIKYKNPIFIDNYPKPNRIYKKIMNHYKKTKYLECGSIGLKMSKVIFGQADCFIKNVKIRDWDVAPALLFAKINNIRVTDFNFTNYSIGANYEKKGIIVIRNHQLKKINNIIINEKINFYN